MGQKKKNKYQLKKKRKKKKAPDKLWCGVVPSIVQINFALGYNLFFLKHFIRLCIRLLVIDGVRNDVIIQALNTFLSL